MIRTSELRVKDVVNALDGRRLGPVSDLEIDIDTGQVKAVMVPGPPRFLGIIGRGNDYVIPWERIKRIGLDVILVEVSDAVDPREFSH
ncbi:MAG: YlmC/YmxH family sporulation protein [Firmicutes bacterium]|nr:YlmC/YmxH family sporulation protein [Bacillota bacterium]